MESEIVTIEFFKLEPDVTIPTRGSTTAAGWDLRCIEDAKLKHREVTLIRTGLALAIPDGWEGQLRCRSGLAKKGMMVSNGIGTIDSDYRGEIMILATWVGPDEEYVINKGERIAQILIKKVPDVEFKEVTSLEELGNTERGSGGFGSTGIR